MQDAVILANCIYDMKSTALDDVAEALQDFKDQRFSHVLGQYNASKINAKILYGQVKSPLVPCFERCSMIVLFWQDFSPSLSLCS